MTQPEPIHIITERCADLATPVAGCTVSWCQTCEAPVWISPTTLREAPIDGIVVCLPCARPLISKEPAPDFSLTDGQRLEIARETGLYGDALDRLLDRVRQQIAAGVHWTLGRWKDAD